METETITSKGLGYVEQKAWRYKESGTDHVAVEECPLCGNTNSKFYMNVSGDASDGLWDCKVCGEKGSLYQLRVKLGDRSDDIVSLADATRATKQASVLPDIAALNYNLLHSEAFADVLDYLVAERGFKMEVIESMQLGAEQEFGKKWLVIPYINKQGNVTFVKYRSVPPAAKEFRSSSGREAGLYNDTIIETGMEELVFVEGEADCLACLSAGVSSVVGVPGANTKKAAWITKVDNAAPKKIYLLYDSDKVGQAAAREMAQRIGLDKAFNIRLPEFTTRDGKAGKDINEWFRTGHSLEDFKVLQSQAKPFDVAGVQNTAEVILEIQEDIEMRGARRYELGTPWPALTERLGGANFGEVIGIIAEGKVGKTTMVMNWLDYYAEQGYPSMLYCLEMTQKALVRKWICYKTNTDDADLNKQTVKDALDLAIKMPADMLFAFSRVNSPKECFDLIRQAVRRYGAKVVAFDNLQFLVRSIDHSAQETANLSKHFKELATELGILILLVVQPNRVREGEIVAARNSNGSSAIEKDVDAMIALHRNRVAKVKADDFKGFLEANENFEPQLLVRVDLSRYAPGGVCTLLMDGGKSSVRSFQQSDIDLMQINQPRTSVGIPTEEPVQI